jgi:hypothetical protein
MADEPPRLERPERQLPDQLAAVRFVFVLTG